MYSLKLTRLLLSWQQTCSFDIYFKHQRPSFHQHTIKQLTSFNSSSLCATHAAQGANPANKWAKPTDMWWHCLCWKQSPMCVSDHEPTSASGRAETETVNKTKLLKDSCRMTKSPSSNTFLTFEFGDQTSKGPKVGIKPGAAAAVGSKHLCMVAIAPLVFAPPFAPEMLTPWSCYKWKVSGSSQSSRGFTLWGPWILRQNIHFVSAIFQSRPKWWTTWHFHP